MSASLNSAARMASGEIGPGRWLALIGLGEDGVDGLSGAARALIGTARLVVGGIRHLDLVAPLIGGEVLAWPRPLADAVPTILAWRGEPVAVLASGDPYFHGVGNLLARFVSITETLCLPAPSAFSWACARLGWARQEVATISCCGRPIAALRPLLQPEAHILALSADATTPAALAGWLSSVGFGSSRLTVLEALGGPRERIRTVRAADFTLAEVLPLNLVAIEAIPTPATRVLPLAPGLPEDWFEHDGQITRREIRALTLSALAPRQGEMLWDIGCGAGSIGIEWMLRHPLNRAIGIEMRPERAARAARNAVGLGVPELDIRAGTAPALLAGLPTPDAVFVGGGGRDVQVIETAWAALRPGGRIVVNSVTVETDIVLADVQARLGGNLIRIAVERLAAIGGRRGYRPAMTVTQWSAEKPIARESMP